MTHTELKERIDTATSADNKWNAWPDQLAVVNFRSVDLTSPREAYAYGYLIASYQAYRQVRFHDMPREVWDHVKAAGWNSSDMSLVYVYFTLAGARGQQDDPTKRNVLAVTQPRDNYDSYHYKPGHRPDYHPGLIIELGCDHDYDDSGSRHERGYHLGKCRKCGHKFMCDSGD